MPKPLNYTTSIAADKTVAECQMMLGEHGADAIAITFKDRRPAGLRFMLDGNTYVLPVDAEAMSRVLAQAHRDGQVKSISRAIALSAEHAERVAWRVVKDWLEAQLALAATSMAGLDEVMLPYLLVDQDRTLRHQWRERLALPAGGDSG